MRRRTAIFFTLLFYTLAPCALLLPLLAATRRGEVIGLTCALCAVVALAFLLAAVPISGRLSRPVDAATPATDSLTGLLTRRAAQEQIRSALAQPPQGSALLILADIHKLRTVNRLHGHLEGDRLLCALSGALRDLFPGCGIAARIGPASLLLFVPGLPPAEAAAQAQRQLAALAARWPQLAPGGEAQLFLGGACACGGQTSFEALLTQADRALLQCRGSVAEPYTLKMLP